MNFASPLLRYFNDPNHHHSAFYRPLRTYGRPHGTKTCRSDVISHACAVVESYTASIGIALRLPRKDHVRFVFDAGLRNVLQVSNGFLCNVDSLRFASIVNWPLALNMCHTMAHRCVPNDSRRRQRRVGKRTKIRTPPVVTVSNVHVQFIVARCSSTGRNISKQVRARQTIYNTDYVLVWHAFDVKTQLQNIVRVLGVHIFVERLSWK